MHTRPGHSRVRLAAVALPFLLWPASDSTAPAGRDIPPIRTPFRARAPVAGRAQKAGSDTRQSAAIHVVPVSPPDARRPNEVAVAIDPRNPDRVVVVALDAGGPGEPSTVNATYESADGGRTWTDGPGPATGDRRRGDDTIAFGSDGTAWRAFIAFTGLREARPARAASGIFVSRSTAPHTWTPPVAVVDHLNTIEPFEDKPWIAVDAGDTSPHRGTIYVAWTRFDRYNSPDPADLSHIYVSRSTDGGSTFSVPVRISDEPGDALDSDNTVEGVVPAVGPDGEVYVAWAGPKGIVIDVSRDGGLTWGRDRHVADMPGGWDLPVEGFYRHNGMPVAAVDRSTGPRRGTVYVNWIDERNGDPDVFVAASRDGGMTWGGPVRVNDDPAGRGTAQLLTWMAVDPVDGSVNVIFHDRRGLTGTRTAVTLARSIDGGATFINVHLPETAFDPRPDVFFGDYNGIDARGGRVIAVFPVFRGPTTAVMAALARFRPGSLEPTQ